MDMPRSGEDVDGLLGELDNLIGAIAEARNRVVVLTATGEGLDGGVTVTVNARGVVIETTISDEAVARSTPKAIADAVTAAAQQAAAQVSAEAAEIWKPINDRRGGLPRAADALEGIPRIEELLADPPEPPLTKPRAESEDDQLYENVEQIVAQTTSPFEQRSW